jgi:hypothetical protein
MDFKEKALEFIGANGIENEEQFNEFKTSFEKKFIPAEIAHEYEDVKNKVFGERARQIISRLNNMGKAIGIDEVSNRKLAESKIEDIIDEFTTITSTKLNELSTKASEGNDKKVNDLMAQIADKDKTVNSYKEALEKVQSEYEGFKGSKEGEIKSYKIGHQLDQVRGQIQWVDNVSDIQRVGFESYLNSNFQLDLDEKDGLIIKDKEGKLIPNPNKAGSFLSPVEILDQIADKNGLKKKNNVDTK